MFMLYFCLQQLGTFRGKVFDASHKLRGINFGQDRYKRQYWALPRCGGILVEGLESAEPEDERVKEEVRLAESNEHVGTTKATVKETKEDINRVSDTEFKSELTSQSERLDVAKTPPTSVFNVTKLEEKENLCKPMEIDLSNDLNISDRKYTPLSIPKVHGGLPGGKMGKESLIGCVAMATTTSVTMMTSAVTKASPITTTTGDVIMNGVHMTTASSSPVVSCSVTESTTTVKHETPHSFMSIDTILGKITVLKF